jgi:transposase
MYQWLRVSKRRLHPSDGRIYKVTKPKPYHRRGEVTLYFLQTTLLSFEQILEMQPESRLQMLFSSLDLSPLIKKLGGKSRFGPKGYPVAAMMRAQIAMKTEGIPNVAKLVERLKCDFAFRYYCGFGLTGSTPSEATFSRFFKRLAESGAADDQLDAMVAEGRACGLISHEEVAIDSCAIEAHEKARPRKELSQDGQSADWGSKRDSHGNQHTWFGYKTHIAVDCKSELPVAIKVTPANTHDSQVALDLAAKVTSSLPKEKWPRHWIMDMGYDNYEIYEKIRGIYHAQAIIPYNRRSSKEPPEGFDFDGTPICSMGYPMVYWGHDAKTGTNKFRCPHVLGKVDCPQGSAWCSSSSYGWVVKTKIEDNPRLFCAPHRGTRNWKLLYNKRTSVERCFSRLKENLGANRLTVRGIEKVKLHQVISCIALWAIAFAAHYHNKNQVSTQQKTA